MNGSRRLQISSRKRVVCAAVFMASAAGCAREVVPERFEVSGNVSYEGEPIPYGMVVFEDAKTRYPTACSIQNGQYKSQPGKGHQGGESRVSITAFADQPAGGQLGTPLWEGSWNKEVVLPEKTATMNFDIVAADIKKLANAEAISTAPEPPETDDSL